MIYYPKYYLARDQFGFAFVEYISRGRPSQMFNQQVLVMLCKYLNCWITKRVSLVVDIPLARSNPKDAVSTKATAAVFTGMIAITIAIAIITVVAVAVVAIVGIGSIEYSNY